MFRQMDEAFNHMMKSFGAFDGHAPDQEQGISQIPIAFGWADATVVHFLTHKSGFGPGCSNLGASCQSWHESFSGV